MHHWNRVSENQIGWQVNEGSYYYKEDNDSCSFCSILEFTAVCLIILVQLPCLISCNAAPGIDKTDRHGGVEFELKKNIQL